MLAPFLWLGAKLVGIHPIFGSIGKGIGKAWKWATASKLHILIAALIASNAAWFIGHRIDTHSLGKVRGQLAKCVQGRADDRAAAQKALAEAQAKSKQVAETSDVRHTDQLAADLAAGDDYKRAHRVRWQPPAPVQGDAAPVAPQPAPATDMVAISPPDFDACTADYAYSLSAYQFGQDLLAKGLAQ